MSPGSVHYHDGGDDGDEGIAVGQQPVGGLGPAGRVPGGRSDAVQEPGAGRLPSGVLLLRLLLDVVFDHVAVVVSLHGGGATGPQVTQRGPWKPPTASKQPMVEEEQPGSRSKGGLPVACKDRLRKEEAHSEEENGPRLVEWTCLLLSNVCKFSPLQVGSYENAPLPHYSVHYRRLMTENYKEKHEIYFLTHVQRF